MDKTLSTDHFLEFLPFGVDEYTEDCYLIELTNFQEVAVISGVDYFYLWQHLEAFKRVLGSLNYPSLDVTEVV